MSRKILVTGAFGYLGGRISRYLAGLEDYSVRLVSHRSGHAVPGWLPDDGEIVVADLSGAELPASLLEGIDAVVHLAALNEHESQSHPGLALQVSGHGTLALLEACRAAGIRRFVYFSTARVYGEPLEGTISESSMPRPVHPYGIVHRTAEDLVLACHEKGELDAAVLRLSNGFGAPDSPDVNRWTLLANDLCRQAAISGRLELRSSGLQLRNFITLHDVSRAVAHFIELDRRALGDGIFNLAGAGSMSILEMTRLIAARCGVVFGTVPPIERPDPDPDEVVSALDYRIDRLLGSGFGLTADFDAEIDGCLRLCREAFA